MKHVLHMYKKTGYGLSLVLHLMTVIVFSFLRLCTSLVCPLGLLAAVNNLKVYSQQSSILLTWDSPSTLDITGVEPDLWYCVEVYNISRERTALLTTNCSVYEPQFFFTSPNHSRCDLFELTVFAVNQVGNGSVTSVSGTFFPKSES